MMREMRVVMITAVIAINPMCSPSLDFSFFFLLSNHSGWVDGRARRRMTGDNVWTHGTR